jgi:uncharacterized repeat protein (TIGR01451 family)
MPLGGLVLDSAGNLYGTAAFGGANELISGNGIGVVFKVTIKGQETVLYNFCSALNCSDGFMPYAGLIQDAEGNLYGTTSAGGIFDPNCAGAFSCGTVFKLALGSADLFLRVQPSSTTIHQGDLITYAFPVWNLGPDNADFEVLNTQVPAGTTFDYIRISGTPGLGTCTHPPYQGTGQIVCHENSAMAPNTTWTVRLTVKVTAPTGTVITENAATMADTPDPNLANNMATVSIKVQ